MYIYVYIYKFICTCIHIYIDRCVTCTTVFLNSNPSPELILPPERSSIFFSVKRRRRKRIRVQRPSPAVLCLSPVCRPSLLYPIPHPCLS